MGLFDTKFAMAVTSGNGERSGRSRFNVTDRAFGKRGKSSTETSMETDGRSAVESYSRFGAEG